MVLANLLLLISISKSRWRVQACVILSIFALLLLSGDWLQEDFSAVGGMVHSPHASDDWTFYRARQSCLINHDLNDLCIPLPAAESGPGYATLRCNSIGRPQSIEFHLQANQAAITVDRSIIRGDLSSFSPRPTFVNTPLRLLVPAFYPECAPIAQIDQGETGSWPSLVLAKSDPIPKNLTPSSTRASSNK
jgi:hypothetical protein